MLSTLTFNHMNDCYPFLFGTTHRLHLELLQKRIERLRTNPEQSEEQDLEELIGYIQDHKLILE